MRAWSAAEDVQDFQKCRHAWMLAATSCGMQHSEEEFRLLSERQLLRDQSMQQGHLRYSETSTGRKNGEIATRISNNCLSEQVACLLRCSIKRVGSNNTGAIPFSKKRYKKAGNCEALDGKSLAGFRRHATYLVSLCAEASTRTYYAFCQFVWDDVIGYRSPERIKHFSSIHKL